MNGKKLTFINECLLDVETCKNQAADWKKVSDKACPPENPVNCPNNCSDENAYVCAITKRRNTKTFKNLCLLEHSKCLEPQRGYEFQSNGPCSDKVVGKLI